MPSLPMLNCSISNSVEQLIHYYVFFSTLRILLNIIWFFYNNVVTPDKKDEEIRQLKADIENLHNILEEVVTYLNRTKTPVNYDTEKAEFVDETDKQDEEAEAAAPAESAAEDEKKDN